MASVVSIAPRRQIPAEGRYGYGGGVNKEAQRAALWLGRGLFDSRPEVTLSPAAYTAMRDPLSRSSM